MSRHRPAPLTFAFAAFLLAGGVGSDAATAQTTGTADASLDRLNWAEKMFEERSHDFGTVARGAEVRHQLTLTNPYEETVRLVSINKTCGCTNARADFAELATGETGHIEIAMDTVKFMGVKESKVQITLSFAGGSPTLVEVPIRSLIRSDVVIQDPAGSTGSADFGAIAVGVGAEKTLTVDYAGRGDWQITDVNSGNRHVDASVREVARTAGTVSYELVVALKPDAPEGAIRDRLILKTNDPATTDVPVLVEATIEPDIKITPEQVAFGSLRPGQKKTVSVVIRGRQPFQIQEVASEKMDCFAVRLDSAARKPVHVVPLTIDVPDMTGDIDETFEVIVAGRPQPLNFRVVGSVTR